MTAYIILLLWAIVLHLYATTVKDCSNFESALISSYIVHVARNLSQSMSPRANHSYPVTWYTLSNRNKTVMLIGTLPSWVCFRRSRERCKIGKLRLCVHLKLCCKFKMHASETSETQGKLAEAWLSEFDKVRCGAGLLILLFYARGVCVPC